MTRSIDDLRKQYKAQEPIERDGSSPEWTLHPLVGNSLAVPACSECLGKGVTSAWNDKCIACNGTGKGFTVLSVDWGKGPDMTGVWSPPPFPKAEVDAPEVKEGMAEVDCPRCGGGGEVGYMDQCDYCNGTGKVLVG